MNQVKRKRRRTNHKNGKNFCWENSYVGQGGNILLVLLGRKVAQQRSWPFPRALEVVQLFALGFPKSHPARATYRRSHSVACCEMVTKLVAHSSRRCR